jgi:Ca-activated chloride channel family protein
VVPQVWAWKAGRTKILREATDLLFSILPFEKDWLAKLQVHYRLPLQTKEYVDSFSCINKLMPLKTADVSLKKAASVVMFGMKLKDSDFSRSISWRNLQNLAGSSFDKEKSLEKEFLQLIAKAKKMYTHRKKYGGDY